MVHPVITRQHVEMTAKLYKMRDYVLERKKHSPDTYDMVETLIRAYSKKHGKSELESAIELAKMETGATISWLFGVAAAMVEPEVTAKP